MWRPLLYSVPKKFCQKGHSVFCHVWSPIILLKNCVMLILMQECNKFAEQYHSIALQQLLFWKKLVPLHVCNSWHTEHQFFGDATILFEKCEGFPNSKHDNFACLRSRLLDRWRKMYWTQKHHRVCSGEAIGTAKQTRGCCFLFTDKRVGGKWVLLFLWELRMLKIDNFCNLL